MLQGRWGQCHHSESQSTLGSMLHACTECHSSHHVSVLHACAPLLFSAGYLMYNASQSSHAIM